MFDIFASSNKTNVFVKRRASIGWWRANGGSFPAWALAARIVFALSPNSASCERVFSLVKQMFGEQQMTALADYLRAALSRAHAQVQPAAGWLMVHACTEHKGSRAWIFD